MLKSQTLSSLSFPENISSQLAANQSLRDSLRAVASFLMSLADEDNESQSPKLTLKTVVEQYQALQHKQAITGELSWSFRNRQKRTLDAWVRSMGDISVESITSDRIASVFATLKNRQVSGLSPDTIQTEIKGVQMFLNWLEDSGQWKPTFNMRKAFQFRKQRLFTLEEMKKRAEGQKVFTADELARLNAVASPRQRLYLLLGLNLAATQKQLGDLLKADLHLDQQPPVIEFIRSKTRFCGSGSIGHYELWPETADVLRKAVSRTPKNSQWALLTKDGQQLVRFKENGSRCDPIIMAWKKLLDKTKFPEDRRLSFKYLRKTISDMVLRLSDETVQQQMLAHARRSMAGRHYTGRTDFSRLSQTLQRVRTEILYSMLDLPQPLNAAA